MTIRIPKAVLAILLVLLIGGGAAVGGYFVGQSDQDEDAAEKAERRGYRRGFERGKAVCAPKVDSYALGYRQGYLDAEAGLPERPRSDAPDFVPGEC